MSYDEILLYAGIGIQQRINALINRIGDDDDPVGPEEEYWLRQDINDLLQKRTWVTDERNYHPQREAHAHDS